MKMVMARRPHAIVKHVDISGAQAVPGVVCVLTSRDVPCNEFGYYTYDQPVLCGPCSKPYADRVRFVGDRVAAVVAETEEIAQRACALIQVEYEDLPVVCDAEEAMQPGAPCCTRTWVPTCSTTTSFTMETWRQAFARPT